MATGPRRRASRLSLQRQTTAYVLRQPVVGPQDSPNDVSRLRHPGLQATLTGSGLGHTGTPHTFCCPDDGPATRSPSPCRTGAELVVLLRSSSWQSGRTSHQIDPSCVCDGVIREAL